MTAKELLSWALQHPSFAHTVHVSDIRESMVDAARAGLAKLKGPGSSGDTVAGPAAASMEFRPAYVKIGVDDRIVVALKGPPEKSPYIFLVVAVPSQVLDRAESLIVMPGEH